MLPLSLKNTSSAVKKLVHVTVRYIGCELPRQIRSQLTNKASNVNIHEVTLHLI